MRTGTLVAMVNAEQIEDLSTQQLRELASGLIAQIASRDQQIAQREQAIASKDREIVYRQAKIDQLTHEIAVLRRHRFGKSSEQLGSEQASLLDETVDADLVAIEQELEQLAPSPKADVPRQPKRAPLPLELPRVEHRHEPESTTCTTPGCGCAPAVARRA